MIFGRSAGLLVQISPIYGINPYLMEVHILSLVAGAFKKRRLPGNSFYSSPDDLNVNFFVPAGFSGPTVRIRSKHAKRQVCMYNSCSQKYRSADFAQPFQFGTKSPARRE